MGIIKQEHHHNHTTQSTNHNHNQPASEHNTLEAQVTIRAVHSIYHHVTIKPPEPQELFETLPPSSTKNTTTFF